MRMCSACRPGPGNRRHWRRPGRPGASCRHWRPACRPEPVRRSAGWPGGRATGRPPARTASGGWRPWHEGVVAAEAGAHLVFVEAGVHGDLGAGCAGVQAQGAAHGHAVQAGHFHVEHDGVEGLAAGGFQRVAAVVHRLHAVAQRFQQRAQQRAGGVAVIHRQDAAPGTRGGVVGVEHPRKLIGCRRRRKGLAGQAGGCHGPAQNRGKGVTRPAHRACPGLAPRLCTGL